MFLLILDKNPYKAVELIPDRLKFKSLLELCQLICSAGISDVYKPIKQGKELQEWVKNNLLFIDCFYESLFVWVISNVKIKNETKEKFTKIGNDLFKVLKKAKRNRKVTTTAIFRYVKEYAEFTEYESNAELPIETAISEYKRYVEWKGKQFKAKRGNNGYKQ